MAKEYDVLIIGGGVAGVGAALECSRSGLKTALVEKTVLWGGLATSGLVPIYMPLCDGRGRQVTFGIAEELLDVSIKYGPGKVPENWYTKKGDKPDKDLDDLYSETKMSSRYLTIFSPMSFALGLDEVLQDSNVDLWLDTLACSPVMSGRKITGVEVENKSGRISINASCVIDGTGDADIAFRCGAPCREKGSYPSFLYQITSLKRAKQAVEKNSASRLVFWHSGGGANEYGTGYDGDKGIFTGTDGKGVSEFIMESRRIAREKLKAEQAEKSVGRENLYPATLPTMAQIRMSRCIEGEETLTADMVNKYNENSIGLIADVRKTGDVWEMPYGTLIPKNIENLLVIGRCASAEDYGWQITRLIAPAVLTGQIAGIAAKMSVEGGTSPCRLEVKDVQNTAENKGIVLHM